MYRLAVFVLVSCVASQRLVGAARRGESRSGRSGLFFDSYDRPSLEELEESEDGSRDAILMHPEQVLDVPQVERDYEMADLDTEEPLLEDRLYDSVRDSQMTRGLFQDLLEEIQSAFSTWPPKLPNKPTPTAEYRYQIDHSLLDTQKTDLKFLLATVEEKTCMNIAEEEESPQIIFMGVQGCSIEAVENKIFIGYECFEPTMILKLIFRLFGFCATNTPEPTFKANGSPIYIENYRSKMQREAEQDTDCNDIFPFCHFFSVNASSSYPCSSCTHTERALCSRTCRLCGDTCVDYDPDCNTHDILKDCLSNWNQKKVGCANTCGVCKNTKDTDICVDYYPCCQYLAKEGYCPKFPKLMKKFCAPSCGYCKPKSCVDLRNDCSELKKLGGCQNMADLMGKNCPRTCSLCGNGVENRENGERRLPENCKADDDFVQKYCYWNPLIFN